MITNAIIQFFGGILANIVNALPDAPIVAIGSGAAAGTACCATFLISSLTTVLGVSISAPTGAIALISGGISGLANSPISLVIDWTLMGFAVGCAMAFVAAFLIIRIMIMLWQQVKW